MTQTTKTKQILIVEDDENSQSVMRSLLEHHTFQVTLAANGKQALEHLEEQQFDAFIIDLSMPEMDGWQLLNVLRNDTVNSQIPCIAITAFHSAEVAMKAIDAGFTAYFSKPINVYTFEKELSDLLDKP